MSEEEQKLTVGTMFWILVIIAIGALIVLFFFSHTVHDLLLATIGWIGSFTGEGPLILGLVFFGIMVVQSIAVPIPSELCLIAGGAAFAVLYDVTSALAISATIGFFSSIVGAIMLYYLGKKGGRPLVIKLLGKSTMDFVDNWFQRWGVWAVGLGRLLPVVFYDPISLVSGATDMDTKHYMYGTLVGTVPRVIFYCGLGVGIIVSASQAIFDIILIVLVAVGLVLLLVYWLMFRRYSKKEKDQQKEAETTS